MSNGASAIATLSPALNSPADGVEEIPDGQGGGDNGDGGGTADDAGGDSGAGAGAGDGAGKVGADGKPAAGAVDASKISTSDFKKFTAELSKTNKPLAEQLTADRYKVLEFEKAGFKTPAEASAFKEAVETYGGLEELETIASDAREFGGEIMQLANGDPALIDKLSKESPEGLSKLAMPFLEKLKSFNPEEYKSISTRLVADALGASNVSSHASLLLKAILDGDQNAAKSLAERLDAHLKTYGEGAKAAAAKDPERENFLKEKQTWETQKQTEAQEKFATDVLGGVNPKVTAEVIEHINSFLPKGYKLPEATLHKMVGDVFADINAKLLEKKDYATRYEALLKTKDARRVAQFIHSRTTPILYDLAKKTYDIYKGSAPAAARRVAPKAGAPAAGGQKTETGVENRKPTFSEAARFGFSKEDYLQGVMTKKLVKNGKTVFAWS